MKLILTFSWAGKYWKLTTAAQKVLKICSTQAVNFSEFTLGDAKSEKTFTRTLRERATATENISY